MIYLRIILTAGLIIFSCNRIIQKEATIIRLKGSNTMLFLAIEWATAYMETHGGISVYVEGGGSSTGFNGLVDGTADIALASRLIRTREASQIAARHNTLGMSFLVAKDGLSIFLSNENPVSNLTVDQLRKIFTGEYTNWKEVGGTDDVIDVVIRPPSSGTHVYFREFVLENEFYSKNVKIIPTTTEIEDYVNKNKNAISYGGIAFGQSLKHCSINSVPSEEENVRNGSYPLIRYLYVYTINTPSGWTKDFIEWMLGPEGQKIVKTVGYIPLWEIE